jgi:SAM-dependent methyltransferase
MIAAAVRRFTIDDLGRFDDEALTTFLDPADGGIRPAALGLALQGRPELARRVESALPDGVREEFTTALGAPAVDRAVARARSRVIRRLFWPLVYWCDPDVYVELTAGEDLPSALIDHLPIDGRVVADVGAGAGRFTIPAARRASRVIAIDAVPALLSRLAELARTTGLGNITTRRGSFRRLPLPDRSVDVAVFCSSLQATGPHGGDGALREAERVVRAGGDIVVVWPEGVDWLLARGFSLLTAGAAATVRFTDPETAERLCRDFYGTAAASWVRRHKASEVPCSLIGRPAAAIACARHVVAGGCAPHPPPSRSPA